MAAGVYVALVRLPNQGGAGEAVKFDNISATTAAFRLDCGGTYMLTAIGTFTTVTLQVQGEDGSTFVTSPIAALSAAGSGQGNLAPGIYKIAIA